MGPYWFLHHKSSRARTREDSTLQSIPRSRFRRLVPSPFGEGGLEGGLEGGTKGGTLHTPLKGGLKGDTHAVKQIMLLTSALLFVPLLPLLLLLLPLFLSRTRTTPLKPPS